MSSLALRLQRSWISRCARQGPATLTLCLNPYFTVSHPDKRLFIFESQDGCCIKMVFKDPDVVDRKKRKRAASESAEDSMEADEDAEGETKFRSEAKRHEGPSIFRFGRKPLAQASRLLPRRVLSISAGVL